MSKSIRFVYKSILFVFIFVQISYFFLIMSPGSVDSGNLYSASVTLSSSRLSYYGRVNGAHLPGATSIAIKTSRSSYLPPDINTNHLFPMDDISIGANGYCDSSGTTECRASTIQDTNNFTLVKGLRVGVSDSDPIYATQSAKHSIAFTTQTTVVGAGTNSGIVVWVPAGGTDSGTSQDGAPDGGPNAGFDLNSVAAGNVTCPTQGSVGWDPAVVTAYQQIGGTGSYYHKFTCKFTGTLASTALTMTIGDNTKAPVNPAPKITSSYTHSQGGADSYNVKIMLIDDSSNIIDDVIVTVSPIEAVLVSATVNPSLTMTIAGQNDDSPCGMDDTSGKEFEVTGSTAYSVPFGDITSTSRFYDAAQSITISTNGTSGYYLKAAQDDEMSADLNGDGVPETTLADATCDDSSCSHTDIDDWDNTVTAGFGYSIENISAASVPFEYDTTSGNCAGGTYCAKNFACVDYLNPSVPAACGTNDSSSQTIASSSTVASAEEIYVCYRLNVSATQPAGYYQTRVYYVAYGTF